MSFERLGLAAELIRAVEEEGWILPTDVQDEAIPLILGGGDVMAAAETGSGKTGAFVLPILQIIHETRRNVTSGHDSGASGAGSARATPAAAAAAAEASESPVAAAVALSASDRDVVFAVSPDGLSGQSRAHFAWAGARATVGVRGRGHYYFEATMMDEGICRVGWSTQAASFNLGTDAHGVGYGGTAKKSHKGQFLDYGGTYGKGDVIGCFLDLDGREVSFSRNGRHLGKAFDLPPSFLGGAVFPAVAMRNGEVRCAFGGSRDPVRHPPASQGVPGAVPIARAPAAVRVVALDADAERSMAAVKRTGRGRSPLAIILEPARDLAEQTFACVDKFRRYLASPALEPVLLIGGPPGPQKAALAAGCDVVVGTPARVLAMARERALDPLGVRFFVLDEADHLLANESAEDVMKLFNLLPKNAGTRSTDRLQVCFFSATLHSAVVREYAEQLCHRATWVDLKGKDAVPETVDHLVVPVDPEAAAAELDRCPARIPTDGVHAGTNPSGSSPEALSERVKRLKLALLLRLIDALHMDQCMLFCRTNVDCDNLERFLVEAGGGTRFSGKAEKGKENPFSCCVLAGMRSPEERRRNLRAFQEGDVRFLICTDVAARGIDVKGLPFMVNVTLPDSAEQYIHRSGRVGRAERTGLAISLVATCKERVWYHRCNRKDRGRGCTNRRLVDEGGCTIWYDEPALWQDVQRRLKCEVPRINPDFTLPKSLAGGYGGEAGAAAASEEVRERLAVIRPAVDRLADLEVAAQSSFLGMQDRVAGSGARAWV